MTRHLSRAPARAPRATAWFTALALLAAAPWAAAEFSTRGIEIDGNYEDDPGPPEEDWFPGFPPSMDPLANEDDTLCGTSPAPKNDIVQYFLANNFEYLWVGMERLTNNGNTSFFFSFDITGDGPSTGDFIFVFCFGSGEEVTDTFVLEWDDTLGEWVRDPDPTEIVFAVNTSPTFAPFGTVDERGRRSATIGSGRFAEARITLADIEGFDVCLAHEVTAEIQTKSSCSLSSECKDTTGPFTFSFEPISVALELTQPPDCRPFLVATANADSPLDGVTYTWFLNGEDITGRDPSYATSDTIVIELDEECGPVDVRVIADDGTCTAEDAGSLDIRRRPVAAIAGLSAGDCDLTIQYDAAGSSDCNDDALSYAWDFDSDGVIDSTDVSGSFVVSSCGPRLVTLVVSDGECLSEPVTQALHVNEPPVAGLNVVPDGCLGVTWSSTSTDCDLGSPSPLYTESLVTTIDFGDGSPPQDAESGAHEYAECGTYVLTLNVTDASGCISTASREVTFTGVLTVD